MTSPEKLRQQMESERRSGEFSREGQLPPLENPRRKWLMLLPVVGFVGAVVAWQMLPSGAAPPPPAVPLPAASKSDSSSKSSPAPPPPAPKADEREVGVVWVRG